MSAIHNYKYRQRQQRQEYLNRVQSKTREFYQRYMEVMSDMCFQGIDQVIPTEFAQLTQELDKLKLLICNNPEEAREMSIALGNEVYGLRRLANTAKTRLSKQLELERRHEEERLQKKNEQSEKLWRSLKTTFNDPIERDFAFNDLIKLESEYIDLSEDELNLRISDIKQRANVLAQEWKNKQQETSLQDTQIEVLNAYQEQLKTDLNQNPEKLQTILNSLQDSRDFLDKGEMLSTEDLQSSINAQVSEADEVVTDERCRQITVKGIIDSLRQQGFQVDNPKLFKDNQRDEVVIQAKRISGRQSKFTVSLDGSFSYKFENYEGMACKDDIEKILPKLQDIYGIELSDKKVIWENPDRNLRSARSIDNPNNNEQEV
ncbi:hypothetical protein [Psychrobacter piscatorii]|uniref:hypothetical protein n=1 Tax=Psychrobacter piscatorii TaxID=554343 RepID=UPI003735B098